MGLLAAAGCGIAGMAGIMQNKQSSSLSQNATTHGSKIPMATVATCGGQTSTLTSHLPHHRSGGGSLATAGELDVLIREAQKNGRCHIRTLSTLAVINLVCWVPLYVVALVAPVGKLSFIILIIFRIREIRSPLSESKVVTTSQINCCPISVEK